eukprot:980341-Rhodomonas_salina.2
MQEDRIFVNFVPGARVDSERNGDRRALKRALLDQLLEQLDQRHVIRLHTLRALLPASELGWYRTLRRNYGVGESGDFVGGA